MLHSLVILSDATFLLINATFLPLMGDFYLFMGLTKTLQPKKLLAFLKQKYPKTPKTMQKS